MKLIRKKSVLNQTGDSNSGFYVNIADETFPPPVKIGLRAVAWPEHEVQAIIAARVAGWSKVEIRELVATLKQNRKLGAPEIPSRRGV
jgi:prophage regulatory protein